MEVKARLIDLPVCSLQQPAIMWGQCQAEQSQDETMVVASKASSRIGTMSIYAQWTVTGMLSRFVLGYWEKQGSTCTARGKSKLS